MPIGNYYTIIACPCCDWETVHYQKSDVILGEQDLPPQRCPQCGNEDLQIKPMSSNKDLLSSLINGLGKLIK